MYISWGTWGDIAISSVGSGFVAPQVVKKTWGARGEMGEKIWGVGRPSA